MGDYVLFQMYGPFRQSLIDEHLFYIEQAQKRLLSQFTDIEKEADSAAEEWLNQHKHYFDPDRDDPGSFYETANNAGIEFYRLLSDMRNQTYLNVVAGMFHEWDKKLRSWLVGEVHHWHLGEKAAFKIWAANFSEIFDLLECFSWPVRTTEYFGKLNACRLVVNVYKHGEGNAFADLKRDHPEYLSSFAEELSWYRMVNHTHLLVNDTQLQSFSDAIVAFWQGVPENTFESKIYELPSWLCNALSKDHEVTRRKK
ncbi:hypothetical protein [Iodobacter fluviatilis]|uniref:Uncharacterized protein n=1 Tax=Iodobacter fluviatilis TaxID=537 RepID=A0A377Q486_9NEIS|nr:hypothetical protein [Iodobacter fluviatilis]TCU84568.1 hypothetical protein EV682_10993 [Iodobacter fluviatilis]STQ90034.1 Uncharacterised protein [Iodobacter fluviatilis]